jgi:hypothetical protein
VKVVGQSLSVGLTAAPLFALAPGTVRVSGKPGASGTNYIYLRVTDADGDPAWRIFTFYVAGGPGTLLEADLRGADPGLHTPWLPTYVLAPAVGSYSGLVFGAGSFGAAGNDALTYSVNAPATMSSLAQALAENEYVRLTLQAAAGSTLDLRRGEVRFTINRQDYHAPRSYAVFTSVAGFALGQEVFTTPQFWETDEPREFTFTLPDLPAYDGLTAPLEIRLYGFDAQYGGHRTRLTAFKLREEVP